MLGAPLPDQEEAIVLRMGRTETKKKKNKMPSVKTEPVSAVAHTPTVHARENGKI
jgi:hypothetical protein